MSDINEQGILEENIIELSDEDGNVVKFEHLLTFEYGESFYVALLPIEATEELGEDEVMLMRLEENDEEDVFLPIETEEELEGAWNMFIEIYYEGEDEPEDDED